MPARIIELFEGVDRILHAGDILERSVLDELSAVAPVDAVLGNMDLAGTLGGIPAELVVEVRGMNVGMIHDSGPSAGRRAAMSKRFPDCRPRMAKHQTVAFLEIEGSEPRAEIVRL